VLAERAAVAGHHAVAREPVPAVDTAGAVKARMTGSGSRQRGPSTRPPVCIDLAAPGQASRPTIVMVRHTRSSYTIPVPTARRHEFLMHTAVSVGRVHGPSTRVVCTDPYCKLGVAENPLDTQTAVV